jgi:hypothetical protein
MGGFFSSPSPPPPPPPPPPVSTVEDEERKARLDSIARNRRGRGALVTTSDRGVMGESENAPYRKTLLGE